MRVSSVSQSEGGALKPEKNETVEQDVLRPNFLHDQFIRKFQAMKRSIYPHVLNRLYHAHYRQKVANAEEQLRDERTKIYNRLSLLKRAYQRNLRKELANTNVEKVQQAKLFQ